MIWGDDIPGVSYREFVDAAASARTELAFRRSAFFARHGAALLRVLSTPRIVAAPRAEARRSDVLRVVHWNIEKGKELAGLERRFREDPELRDADLVTLNEVDRGMLRAGANADVAAALAATNDWHRVYLPSYLECTKGVNEELRLPGENTEGLHGLCILSRWPILEARMRPLPHCFDYFDFEEKRFGFRQGLYALVDWDGQPIACATTHLEVRETPACRAHQFGAALRGFVEAIEEWGQPPAIVTGDWNTNSFPRGGLGNSARGFLRIVTTDRGALDRELCRPESREPLFRVLRAAGFDWESFNDFAATAQQALGTVEDLGSLPRAAGRALIAASGLRGRVLQLRLDWIAARGFMAAGPPRTRDARPMDPSAPRELSDHALLLAEMRLS